MEENMNIVTKEEARLIQKLASAVIYNGNHMELIAFEPSPSEYKVCCSLLCKLAEVTS